MNKILMMIALSVAALSTNASVILSTGDSYSTSFALVSDGDAFKATDNFCDINLSFASGPIASADVHLDLFENPNATALVLSDAIAFNNFDSFLYVGNQPFFSDHDGALTVTYTGAGSIELNEIFVANFSGTLDPSSVAFATIDPSVSQVPLPAAGWLMLSGLGLLGFVRRK